MKVLIYGLCIFFILLIIICILMIIEQKNELKLLRRAEPSTINYIRQLTRFGYATLNTNNSYNNTNLDFTSNYDFSNKYNNYSNSDFSAYTNDIINTNNDLITNTENNTNKENEKFKNEKCLGDFAISGIAKPSLFSPHSNSPCIFYEYKKEHIYTQNLEEHNDTEINETKSDPFELIDEDFQITVHPTNIPNNFYGREDLSDCENVYTPECKNNRYKHTENIMRADQRVTVYGSVFMNDKDEVYIKSSKKYHEFVVTNKSHEDTIKASTKFARALVILLIVCLVITGGLLYFILTRYWHILD